MQIPIMPSVPVVASSPVPSAIEATVPGCGELSNSCLGILWSKAQLLLKRARMDAPLV